MSYCTNCGGLLDKNDLFCPYCGSQREKPGAGPLKTPSRTFLKLGLILAPIVLLLAALWYFGLRPGHGGNARGNTTGNIVNGGHVAQQGDWIYYLNIDDDEKIYKVRTDGSDRTRVNDDTSWHLNVVGDWIYYTNIDDDDEKKIYKICTDGSDRTRVNDDSSFFLNVVGDWIYYTNIDDDEKIYKIRTDGSDRTRVNDDSSFFLNVVGDWIFYENSDDEEKIYKIRTDGSGRQEVN